MTESIISGLQISAFIDLANDFAVSKEGYIDFINLSWESSWILKVNFPVNLSEILVIWIFAPSSAQAMKLGAQVQKTIISLQFIEKFTVSVHANFLLKIGKLIVKVIWKTFSSEKLVGLRYI